MWHHEHLFLESGNEVEMTDKVSFKVPSELWKDICTHFKTTIKEDF